MPRVHVVAPGECLTSIAAQYGFSSPRPLAHTNGALLAKRNDGHELFPGDEIQIPDRPQHDHACATGRGHAFVHTRARRKLKLRIFGRDRAPLASTPFTLTASPGFLHRGRTTPSGEIDVAVPPALEAFTLRAGDVAFELRLGHLNPMEDVADGGRSGAWARLVNLGYAHLGSGTSAALAAAIRRFQRAHRLREDGELSSAVLARLKTAYDDMEIAR